MASAPQAAPLSPASPAPGSQPNGPQASQYRAEVASIFRQLADLGNQLQAVTLLGARLQTLIVRLESLTRIDPAVSPLLSQLEGAGDSMPTVGSLVARVVLLDRLLAHLTSVNPLAAWRLALALPELHALVADLLRAAKHSGGRPGSEPLSSSRAAVDLLRPLLGVIRGQCSSSWERDGVTRSAELPGRRLRKPPRTRSTNDRVEPESLTRRPRRRHREPRHLRPRPFWAAVLLAAQAAELDLLLRLPSPCWRSSPRGCWTSCCPDVLLWTWSRGEQRCSLRDSNALDNFPVLT